MITGARRPIIHVGPGHWSRCCLTVEAQVLLTHREVGLIATSDKDCSCQLFLSRMKPYMDARSSSSSSAGSCSSSSCSSISHPWSPQPGLQYSFSGKGCRLWILLGNLCIRPPSPILPSSPFLPSSPSSPILPPSPSSSPAGSFGSWT